MILFVEGLSDDLFVNNAVKKMKPNTCIKVYEYAEKRKKYTTNYIKALNKMYNNNTGIHYLFLADNDSCIYPNQKIGIIANSYPDILMENIVIVENEIESWYMAGLDRKACKKLKIKWEEDPDNVTKEIFKKSLGRRNRLEICPKFFPITR